MKTTSNLHEVFTSCGNVLRGIVQVNDRDYTIESDGAEWLNIIDSEGRCENCVIDEDGDVIAESGECVTQEWTAGDWQDLTGMVIGE